jgi:hypothetical protein
MGRENITDRAAKLEREKSFAANSEAAYGGYAKAMYISMHWKTMKTPIKVRQSPMTVPIQWTNGLAVHADSKDMASRSWVR